MIESMSGIEKENPEATAPCIRESSPQRCEGGIDEDSRRRVEEYHRQALNKADPLQASLGSLNAGLMRMGITVGRAINDYLAVGTNSLERISEAARAVELHCRLTRQIERFAQIDFRPARQVREEANAAPRRPR